MDDRILCWIAIAGIATAFVIDACCVGGLRHAMVASLMGLGMAAFDLSRYWFELWSDEYLKKYYEEKLWPPEDRK